MPGRSQTCQLLRALFRLILLLDAADLQNAAAAPTVRQGQTPPGILALHAAYTANSAEAAAAERTWPPPGPVKDWDVNQVCQYLTSLQLGLLQGPFRENAVDGEMLLELSQEDLIRELGLTTLQASKVISRLPKDESKCTAMTCADAGSLRGFSDRVCQGLPAVGEEIVFLQSLTFKLGNSSSFFKHDVPALSKALVINIVGEEFTVKISGFSRLIGNFQAQLNITKHAPILSAVCAAKLSNSNWQEYDMGWTPDTILSGEIWDVRNSAHQDAAVAVTGVRQDALLRRFVPWNASDLSRGTMDLRKNTPGRDSSFSYQTFYSAQGFVKQNIYDGLPLMKSVWDLQLFSMLIQELRPRTIIEVGTGVGSSAMWFAGELMKLGNDATVHTFGFPFSGNQKEPRHQRVVFHPGNVADIETMFPDALLAELPHPWLVDEDAHQNVQATARLFFKHMHVGDYYVCEDADSHHMPQKRKPWYEWLHECGNRCALDLMYADFYGVNQNWAPDGWIKKIAD